MVVGCQTKIWYQVGSKSEPGGANLPGLTPVVSVQWAVTLNKAFGVLNQPQPDGFGDGLDTIRHLQLSENVLNFALDR